MPAQFVIYQDKAGAFRFKLFSATGKQLVESEAYKTKSSAENGIESIRKNSANPKAFVVKADTAGHGGYFMSLKAGNGQVICHSRGHKREQLAKQAASQVSACAADATVLDRC